MPGRPRLIDPAKYLSRPTIALNRLSYDGDFAGDCCCHNSVHSDGCHVSNMTPGIADSPPTPW